MEYEKNVLENVIIWSIICLVIAFYVLLYEYLMMFFFNRNMY